MHVRVRMRVRVYVSSANTDNYYTCGVIFTTSGYRNQEIMHYILVHDKIPFSFLVGRLSITNMRHPQMPTSGDCQNAAYSRNAGGFQPIIIPQKTITKTKMVELTQKIKMAFVLTSPFPFPLHLSDICRRAHDPSLRQEPEIGGSGRK